MIHPGDQIHTINGAVTAYTTSTHVTLQLTDSDGQPTTDQLTPAQARQLAAQLQLSAGCAEQRAA